MGQNPDPEVPLAGQRILVVEDEFLIALDMGETFRGAGADIVGPFATFAGALDAAKRANISAAVLDVCIGTHTTAEVAVTLAARDIPFLFCTGQALPEELRARFSRIRTLIKPVCKGALLNEITHLVGRV